MVLRTFGGLVLEGSDFARPMRLLLLAYLAIEGPTERADLNDVFAAHVGDRGVRDPRKEAEDRAKNLTTALGQIRRGVSPDMIVRSKGMVEVAVPCDAVAFDAAVAEGNLESAAALVQGPFLHEAEQLRYMRPDRWSPELAAWVRATRLRYAARAVTALTRLGRTHARLGDDAAATELAQRAYQAFDAAFDLDEYTREHSRFDADDLRVLDALLALRPGPAAERFRELAAAYVDLDLPLDPADAIRRHLQPVAHDTPETRGEVVGRRRDAEQVAVALDDARGGFVTIVGTGGVGKTTLALHVARRRRAEGRYPDGVTFVALEDVRFANLIPIRIAAAAGLPLEVTGDALDRLITQLQGRRMMLVLDNYEQLLDRADVAARIAAACLDLDVVVTSRERLHAPHEVAHPLTGLSVEETRSSEADGSDAGAVGWFVRAARSRSPDLVFDQHALATIARLCRYLEGHPLAIELAAALVDLMPLDDLEARLRADAALLEQVGGDASERSRSLHATWESSWAALDPGDRAPFSALAVFQGGFTWDAALHVAGADAAELRRWVDRSLVHTADGQRLHVHPTLKAFLHAKLRDGGGEDRAAERHRGYFLAAAKEHAARLSGSSARSGLSFFELEAANVRAAWESTSDPDLLRDFARALATAQLRLGDLDGRMALLGKGRTAAADAGRPGHAAELANAVAEVHLLRGEVDEAHAVLSSVLDRPDDHTDDAVRAETLSQMGGVHYLRREHDAAIAHFERARELYASFGDAAQAAGELGNVGAVHFQRGGYDEAVRIWKRALTGHRRSGDLELQALTLNNLGAAHQAVGGFEDAAVCLEKAEALLDTLGDTAGVVSTWLNLGTIAFVQGAYGRSRTLNERALAAFQRADDPLGVALVRTNLAMLDERRGALDLANAALTEALAAQERYDERVHRVATLYNLSTVSLQLGRTARATALARDALELAAETDHPVGAGYALTFLGDALAAAGDDAEADGAYRRAAQHFGTASDVVGSLTVDVRQASRLLASGQAAAAAEQAAAVRETARRHGLFPLAVEAARLAAQAALASGDETAAARAMDRAIELEERLAQRARQDDASDAGEGERASS